jgi:acylphosphatase
VAERERFCVRAVVHGRVQGVWYRGWTVAEATERGLDGWVRNRADGTVEALIAGPTEAVEGLLRACLDGPPMAHVVEVERFSVDPTDRPAPGSGFVQRPTA